MLLRPLAMALLLSVAAASTGCATDPVSAEQAAPAPLEKLTGLQKPPAGDYSTLVVTRDRGFSGAACDTIIYVDGKEVGRVASGQTARFFHSPGRIIVSINSTNPCGGGLKEREVMLTPGATSRYRISIDSTFSMDLSPTAF